MERFELLTSGPENPLLRFSFSAGVDQAQLACAAGVICLLLGHVIFTDCFRDRKIYDSTTLAIGAVSFSVAPLAFSNPLPHIALGLAVALVPFAMCVFGGMGLGDVKLYAALAPVMGQANLVLLFVASIITLMYSIPIMVSTRRRAKAAGEKLVKGQRLGAAPAGPGIAYGVPVTAFLAGAPIIAAGMMILTITIGFGICLAIAGKDRADTAGEPEAAH